MMPLCLQTVVALRRQSGEATEIAGSGYSSDFVGGGSGQLKKVSAPNPGFLGAYLMLFPPE